MSFFRWKGLRKELISIREAVDWDPGIQGYLLVVPQRKGALSHRFIFFGVREPTKIDCRTKVGKLALTSLVEDLVVIWIGGNWGCEPQRLYKWGGYP